MAKQEFFNHQTDLTASKILIYRQYLERYLPKVLIHFGRCFVVDFFCGCGKNGKENGSPLVLIDIAINMLKSPVLKTHQPNAEIVIIFSDSDKKCCDDLTLELTKIKIPKQLKILGPFCESFDSIKEKAFKALGNISVPKLFFLDPFTYSDIGIKDIKSFINIPAAEVLLFLPTFHSYRFKSCADKYPKLKAFLDEFTDKGYEDVNDILEFNESIRESLLKSVGLEYVRSIGLDDGAKKNALFYLTKHITGMMEMNKLVWKFTEDGMTVQAGRKKESTLFDLSTFSVNFNKIKDFLYKHIKDKKELTNVEIIEIVAQKCFTNKHANTILREMKAKGLLTVEYKTSDKTRGFYVSDKNWDKDLAIIKYKEK